MPPWIRPTMTGTDAFNQTTIPLAPRAAIFSGRAITPPAYHFFIPILDQFIGKGACGNRGNPIYKD